MERKRAAAQSIRDTSYELVTAGMEVREKQKHHDNHVQNCTKVQDNAKIALEGFHVRLLEEKARLAKLLARQPQAVQPNRAAAALAKRASAAARASVGGAAGTSGAECGVYHALPPPLTGPQLSSTGAASTGPEDVASDLDSRKRGSTRR